MVAKGDFRPLAGRYVARSKREGAVRCSTPVCSDDHAADFVLAGDFDVGRVEGFVARREAFPFCVGRRNDGGGTVLCQRHLVPANEKKAGEGDMGGVERVGRGDGVERG